ncbi:MAG: UvrD-helicase domain-containing protein [Chloroflexi bacterium]|nr:UvrD-helicase domain-containing protein [Chloroflexota bacterium]
MSGSFSTFPNIAIRASAGTGKTFQLSNRYISLMNAGASPEQILAVTFTRKAAGEILDRILIRLAKAATSPDKLATLQPHITGPALDRSRCVELLGKLLRHLHRLRVSTLDSFFVQIAGRLTLDLGLPIGWQIAEEIADRRLSADALRMLLSEDIAIQKTFGRQDASPTSEAGILPAEKTFLGRDTQPDWGLGIGGWGLPIPPAFNPQSKIRNPPSEMLNLIRWLSKGEAPRSVIALLDSVATDLYDLARQTDAKAWQSLPRTQPLSSEAFDEAIQRIVAFDFPDGRFTKARDENVDSASRGDWATFLTKGLAKPIAAGEDAYYRKPIEAAVVEAYRPLIHHAQGVLIGRVSHQNEATRRVLDKFDRTCQALKMRHRVLRFDDITRVLAHAVTRDLLNITTQSCPKGPKVRASAVWFSGAKHKRHDSVPGSK